MIPMNTSKKATKGRQKIDIKKIENDVNRQVTFSKRRGGLFKKASELCILSGAEIAIIAKSPGKRTFAFGHPNVDTIINRYLAGKAAAPVAENHAFQVYNQQYAVLSQKLEAEKKLMEMKPADGGGKFWWQEEVDHLGLEELERFVKALEELKKNVAVKAHELQVAGTSDAVLALPPPSNNMEDYSVGWEDNFFINPIEDYGSGSIVLHGSHYEQNQF